MPGRKPILTILCLAASAAFAAGCGGDDEPEPSIPEENAVTLASTLQEVQDNVEVGSCLVAADKVQEFQEELSGLPSDVNEEVVDALQRGALNLGELLDSDCEQPEETTTEQTTTEEDTTTEEQTTTEETTTEPTEPTTPTTPTEPPSTGGGGIGPPGSDGL